MLNQLGKSTYYLSNQNDIERPTLGLVCGDKYSLVIDAGNSVEHARDFIYQIEQLNVPPVKYVVITHAHWDHFLGMNEFNALIIVNSLTEKMIDRWRSYAYDDHSLQEYVEAERMSKLCAEIITTGIPERATFTLDPSDIVFEGSLQLDLGNKICVLETITSTHTVDSTIVYVPDEKAIFLGDSAYGTTEKSLYHFKKHKLLPMIEDIRKYDAAHYVLGHESICDTQEMDIYWKELINASEAVTSTSLEEATVSFESQQHRKPNNNERFFLEAFVNDQILRSQ